MGYQVGKVFQFRMEDIKKTGGVGVSKFYAACA